uniref:Uncharacterized protein n=1 Tax=Arundo donax TaxID=35708 RepID=A0A0A8YGS3_ARUDO
MAQCGVVTQNTEREGRGCRPQLLSYDCDILPLF